MINDKFDECADFIGKICMELRKRKPSCVISHAPQTPYFNPSYASPGSDPVYTLIYNNYKTYFDWFNIQFYNNGESNTYEEIFIKSNESLPNTSVLELMNSGIDASYIVVGKPVNIQEGNEGYIPLNPSTNGFGDEETSFSEMVKQAFQEPDLKPWAQNGGEMIWYYNTQQSTGANMCSVINKFVTSNDVAKDNESIVLFFQTVSTYSCTASNIKNIQFMEKGVLEQYKSSQSS